MPDSGIGRFLDSNILIYLASGDAAKADRAEQLLRDGGTVSVQVLNEIANVAVRKMKLSWSDTRDFISLIRDLLTVIPLTEPIHESGLRLAERYQFGVYDGMIVAAALEAGCEVVLSEDLQHGLVVDGRLRIVNPFRA
ncbi:PIN domain-containing protein [Mesorhizobium sp. AaZ16]|uniref:PIN domain-containing protein n=1 Tax=Mesorhizobium sp. AaZ16 TaxID=3402289 RepID=UPI00374EA594